MFEKQIRTLILQMIKGQLKKFQEMDTILLKQLIHYNVKIIKMSSSNFFFIKKIKTRQTLLSEWPTITKIKMKLKIINQMISHIVLTHQLESYMTIVDVQLSTLTKLITFAPLEFC